MGTPSTEKNLDYLLPLITSESVIEGLMLPPNAQYPDGTPIGEPFRSVPVAKGARMGTFWKMRSETAAGVGLEAFEHPFDSGKEIGQHVTNYEKVQYELTRYAAMEPLDKDHVPGTSAPEGFEQEVGAGLRNVLYASAELKLSHDVMLATGYTADTHPYPGHSVDCTGNEWSDPTVNPFTNAASGLVTALQYMFSTGVYVDAILVDSTAWAALCSNPLAQDYVRQYVLMSIDQMGTGSTLPMAAVRRAIKIDPYPAVELFVGLGSYVGSIKPDGLYDPDTITPIWPVGQCIIYARGRIQAGKLRGQCFATLASGGDEFASNPNSGFSKNCIDYRYNLYASHKVINYSFSTMLTGLV